MYFKVRAYVRKNKLTIERCTHQLLIYFSFEQSHFPVPESLKSYLDKDRIKTRPKSWKKFFNRYLPVTDWLFNYNIKNDLVADIIAGFTVAIMHIPQGKL